MVLENKIHLPEVLSSLFVCQSDTSNPAGRYALQQAAYWINATFATPPQHHITIGTDNLSESGMDGQDTWIARVAACVHKFWLCIQTHASCSRYLDFP